MKIATITDDGKTLSDHFGQARQFLVFTVEGGTIMTQELRAGLAAHLALRDGP